MLTILTYPRSCLRESQRMLLRQPFIRVVRNKLRTCLTTPTSEICHTKWKLTYFQIPRELTVVNQFFFMQRTELNKIILPFKLQFKDL